MQRKMESENWVSRTDIIVSRCSAGVVKKLQFKELNTG